MPRSAPQALVMALYGAFTTALQPLVRRKLARRARAEPGYAHAVPERFGHYGHSQGARHGNAPLVWLHAVSLGETRAATALVHALRQALPGMRLLLTHGTATGRAAGAALLAPGDLQAWLPWDSPGAVRRFLGHFRPQVGLLMETEVWPQLVLQCRSAGVPLCLVNARLSDKSLRQARRFGVLGRMAYGALAAVWAQSEADARRLHSLGAPVHGVTGNFKYDLQPDAALLAQGRQWRAAQTQPVVLLASAREGEDALWLDALERFMASAREDIGFDAIKTVANVRWLLVPRHPQRFDAMEAAVRARGLAVLRRSQWGASGPEPAAAGVWLGDSLGEMALYYGMADVALLGGSFAPLGGQNLIEAAACGCPVVMGPNLFNFAHASELATQAGAAFAVADLEAALLRVAQLLQDRAALARASQSGLALAAQHRGAAQRTVRALTQWLDGSRG